MMPLRRFDAACDDVTAWCSFEGMPSVLAFGRACSVIRITELDGVVAAVRQVQDAVKSGCYAVGFISYEAAPAFDGAMRVPPADPRLPLLWFSVYEPQHVFSAPWNAVAEVRRRRRSSSNNAPLCAGSSSHSFRNAAWLESVSPAAYMCCVDRARECIRRGLAYQMNYTMRLRAIATRSHSADLDGGSDNADDDDVESFMGALLTAQHHCGFGAFIDIGTHALLSVSPELFFRWSSLTRRLVTRPMKGTAKRGLSSADDAASRAALFSSAKDRAENLMIVDLLRNDCGRVCEPGSVRVPSLFAIESLPTVLQMTSTVEGMARGGTDLVDILRALFPCGSITGAPKLSSMNVIAELEGEPRGVYCGAILCLKPVAAATQVEVGTSPAARASSVSPRSEFPAAPVENAAAAASTAPPSSTAAAAATGTAVPAATETVATACGIEVVSSVAIRTVVLDHDSGRAVYGVGGGVTWDSTPDGEYEEAQAKAAVLRVATAGLLRLRASDAAGTPRVTAYANATAGNGTSRGATVATSTTVAVGAVAVQPPLSQQSGVLLSTHSSTVQTPASSSSPSSTANWSLLETLLLDARQLQQTLLLDARQLQLPISGGADAAGGGLLQLPIGGATDDDERTGPYAFMRRHAVRMAESAQYFDIPVAQQQQQQQLSPRVAADAATNAGVVVDTANAPAGTSITSTSVPIPPSSSTSTAGLAYSPQSTSELVSQGSISTLNPPASSSEFALFDDGEAVRRREVAASVAVIESFLMGFAKALRACESAVSVDVSPYRRVRLLLSSSDGTLSATAHPILGSSDWRMQFSRPPQDGTLGPGDSYGADSHRDSGDSSSKGAAADRLTCNGEDGGDSFSLSLHLPSSSVPEETRMPLQSLRYFLLRGATSTSTSAPRLLSFLALSPVNRSDVYLYHKTTQRGVYEGAKADVTRWLRVQLSSSNCCGGGIGLHPATASFSSSCSAHCHGHYCATGASGSPNNACTSGGSGSDAEAPLPPFEVLLWNASSELTEFTIGNVVLELPIDDEQRAHTPPVAAGDPKLKFGLFTPPVSSGCLPGVFRASLLHSGVMAERRLRVDDLKRARAVWLINSLRGWVRINCWHSGDGSKTATTV